MTNIIVRVSADTTGYATEGRDGLEIVPESKVNNDPEDINALQVRVRSSREARLLWLYRIAKSESFSRLSQ